MAWSVRFKQVLVAGPVSDIIPPVNQRYRNTSVLDFRLDKSPLVTAVHNVQLNANGLKLSIMEDRSDLVPNVSIVPIRSLHLGIQVRHPFRNSSETSF